MLSANDHPPPGVVQNHSYSADSVPRQQTSNIDDMLQQLSVAHLPIHNVVKMSNPSSPAKAATVDVDMNFTPHGKRNISHLHKLLPASQAFAAQDQYQAPAPLSNARPQFINKPHLHESLPTSHAVVAPDPNQTLDHLRAQYDAVIAGGRAWLESAEVSPDPGGISELAHYIDELEQTQLSCVMEYERLNCELASELRTHAIRKLDRNHLHPSRQDRRDHLVAEREYYYQVRADLNSIITKALGVFQEVYYKAM
ncbi:hypothetical protein F5Y08DRAFT_300130 [Xylaria arbuscula]|nr:hypothetical protein F5Y08DRAFT_300130 [Xylaria arbuscula]